MSVRFKFDWEKSIAAIDHIVQRKPGLTQYYIGKILFFADREHVLDYGRPITGDRYVAMQYGPVPSTIRGLLQRSPDLPDEIIDALHQRLSFADSGNKISVRSNMIECANRLSGSDKRYLDEACDKYWNMPFGVLAEESHQDPAYEEAWGRIGNANEMDISLWLDALDDPQLAKKQIQEKIEFGA